MAMAAPRSSSGTVHLLCGEFPRPHLPLSPPENDPPSDLVGDDDRKDQQAFQDDDDLSRKVRHQGKAVLPSVQHADADGGKNDADRIVSSEKGHGDAGETQLGLVVRPQESGVTEQVIETHEAGQRPGDQEDLDLGGADRDAARFGGAGSAAHRAGLEAQAGPMEEEPDHERGEEGEWKEPREMNGPRQDIFESEGRAEVRNESALG